MFDFLKSKPLLDELSIEWLLETQAWALRNFNAELFYRDTRLVTPSNEHFPGRVDSVQGMAELIFEQVKAHAGLASWPCRVVDETLGHAEAATVPTALPPIGSPAVAPAVDQPSQLTIPYHPQSIKTPETLIASFAHTLAHHLATTAEEPPPATEEQWPVVTEVLAIHLGFGLMLANSAFTFKGGCGGCGGAAVRRHAYLSQDEATYALALFCTLKEIPRSRVFGHLKKHLHPLFKKAEQDIKSRSKALSQLKAIQ